MDARVRLTGLLVLVAMSIGIAELKQNVVAAHELTKGAPAATEVPTMQPGAFVRAELPASAAKIEEAAYSAPSQWSDATPQLPTSSEDEGASTTDMGLMLLFAGGLVMLQLRRRQKSLRHSLLSTV